MAEAVEQYAKKREIGSTYCKFGISYEMIKGSENKSGHMENDVPDMVFRDMYAGDILNTYESFVINSHWDVRDAHDSSSVVLARNNYFYEVFQNNEKKVENIFRDNRNEEKNYIKVEYDNKNIYDVLGRASYLVSNKLKINNNYDYATTLLSTTAKDRVEKKYRGEDMSMIDTLNRVGYRKFSENHFVISGVNLIYSEISINEETINTVSMHHEKIFEDGEFIITVIPVSNDEGYFGETVKQKNLSSTAPQLEGNTSNTLRILEFLSNDLFKELEYMYSGKIFCKYIEDVQIEDTVTLIDDVTSTVGKFRIETFEHILDSQGFRTVLNVKACLDLVDPILDLYNTEITLGLYSDLAFEIEKNEKIIAEKILSGESEEGEKFEVGINGYVKTIYDYYSKLLLQGKRYCKIYHKKEKGLFDEVYPIVDENILANPMNIRVFPVFKKGKELMPTSLKSVFYNMLPHEPEAGVISKIYKDLKKKVKIVFKDLGNWATDSLIYIADFLISIPTFGFHEVLKAPLGMTLRKAVENTYGENTTTLNKDQIDILTNNSDYDKWNVGNKNKLTIGFFNVQAQKKENLVPEVANGDYFEKDENKAYYPKEIFQERRKIKEYNVGKIINDAFDITLLVELYDGFKDGGYTIDSFIKNITPKNYNVTDKMEIFNNKYGSEYGVVISNPNKTNSLLVDTKTFSILSDSEVPKELSDETKRNYLETTLNVSDYNFGINTLKIIWLHNVYGQTASHENVRIKNTRKIIDKYNLEMANDNKLGVIIMADLNLEVCSFNYRPINNTGSKMYLKSSDKFFNRMRKCTTLNRKGEPNSNLYDNVLVSENLNKLDVSNLMVQRFDYPCSDKKIVSDHLPVYISLEKKQ